MDLVKKISAKTLVGDVKKFVADIEDGDTATLYRVFGIAHGLETGSSPYGDWVAFCGSFEGLQIDVNGVVIQHVAAPKVFLPQPMQGILVNALKNEASVEFAVEVKVRKDSKLPTGYEYLVSPVVDIKQNDALNHLRSAAMTKPALEAPKKLKK